MLHPKGIFFFYLYRTTDDSLHVEIIINGLKSGLLTTHYAHTNLLRMEHQNQARCFEYEIVQYIFFVM